MNSGTGWGYPVPATNHYHCTAYHHACHCTTCTYRLYFTPGVHNGTFVQRQQQLPDVYDLSAHPVFIIGLPLFSTFSIWSVIFRPNISSHSVILSVFLDPETGPQLLRTVLLSDFRLPKTFYFRIRS